MLKRNADFLSLQTWMCHFCITMFSKKNQDYDPAAATALLLLRFRASPHVYFHWLCVRLVINPARHPVLISNSESGHC